MNKNLLSPAEIAQKMLDVSEKKANNTFGNMFMLGIMAGIFIALGGAAATVMWGTTGDVGVSKYLGAAVFFPVGIILVVLAGSELFTGNNLMTLGVFSGRISVGGLLKNWSAVYLGNFVGSIIIAVLVFKGQLWGNADGLNVIGQKAVAIANGKVSLSFSVAFYRAILCNIVVVLAVWMATGATTVQGKVLTLWFPVSAFVISGYEHIIANMFFIPVGMFYGAPVTWSQMFTANFLPVTLGNLVGGAVVVPLMYYMIYMNKSKALGKEVELKAQRAS